MMTKIAKYKNKKLKKFLIKVLIQIIDNNY